MLLLAIHIPFSTLAESEPASCVQPNIRTQSSQRFFSELYNLIKPTLNSIENHFNQLSDKITDEFFGSYAHQTESAQVRFTDFDELSSAEQAYLNQRLPFVQTNLSTLLGRDITAEQMPRIALCCSGGGHRAMLFTLGFLKGLQDNGILNCTTYMAGLSGSTWAMSGWIASKKSLDDYLKTLPDKLCHGLQPVKNPELLGVLSKGLILKALNKQLVYFWLE